MQIFSAIFLASPRASLSAKACLLQWSHASTIASQITYVPLQVILSSEQNTDDNPIFFFFQIRSRVKSASALVLIVDSWSHPSESGKYFGIAARLISEVVEEYHSHLLLR